MKKITLVLLLTLTACSRTPAVDPQVSEIAHETSDESLKQMHETPAAEDNGNVFRVLRAKGKDMPEATVAAAQAALDKVMAERKDLTVSEEGKSSVEVTLSPFEKDGYMVTLWVKRFQKDGSSSSLTTKFQNFRMKPGQNLKPELARKFKIMVPPPKHAEPHLGDNISPSEVDEGYKRLHDKLHKKK